MLVRYATLVRLGLGVPRVDRGSGVVRRDINKAYFLLRKNINCNF